MLVYKFGGGVLADSDGIRKMEDIVHARVSGSLKRDIVIVVSALGKMTNAFEELWSDWVMGRNYSSSYERIKSYHKTLAENLFEDETQGMEIILGVLEEVDSILRAKVPENEDEAYDLLVVYGEILSSRLISAHLINIGLDNTYLDARKIICTNSCFRNGKVNWQETENNVREIITTDRDSSEFINNESGNSHIWLTQGFIAGDSNGRSTTLGREGSDFSAAIFAHALNASELTVWKDVPGVMTGDPIDFPNAKKIDQISYLEAIELSYFGAKVLHPNTIKPLQNKKIPLTVKHINKPDSTGTRVISKPKISELQPVIIVKSNQVLVSIQPRDFSFVMEEAMSSVFSKLAKFHFRVNLMQHGAVSLSFCIDYHENHLNSLVSELLGDFKILYNTGLELLTVRHYSTEVIDKLIRGRKIYVQQQSRRTARFVLS